MILMIDNYDSFTWNLVQYLQEMEQEVEVVRNDAIDADGIAALGPKAIVISPGPGTPDDAGVSLETVRRFSGRLPILGVCLGHQAIGQAFGGRIVRAPTLMHGKTSPIRHDDGPLYHGLPNPFEATRYHSLVVDPKSFPQALVVSATTDAGVIMGLRHRSHPTEGVQFHPESILTTVGKDLMRNFLRAAGIA
ncbi:MAG TPA: aminodeoxychorismate/anthranilate synthase component II [Candidatus Polarisedimenticolia bacterium]|nr:aminodeoxychorismate/anthranilate synthase component II [Candidatus Polarisedimenticolia bacterium]